MVEEAAWQGESERTTGQDRSHRQDICPKIPRHIKTTTRIPLRGKGLEVAGQIRQLQRRCIGFRDAKMAGVGSAVSHSGTRLQTGHGMAATMHRLVATSPEKSACCDHSPLGVRHEVFSRFIQRVLIVSCPGHVWRSSTIPRIRGQAGTVTPSTPCPVPNQSINTPASRNDPSNDPATTVGVNPAQIHRG